MQVWADDEHTRTLAAMVGEPTEDASEAEVWLLSGALDAAVARAADARPEQVVVYVGSPSDEGWQQLGRAFDEMVPADVAYAELSARVAAQRTSRRSRPRAKVLRQVAHDLNNPLTAIRLLSEMLAFEVPGDEAKEDLNDILEASDLAAALVESVGAYARLGVQERRASTSVDLSGILTDAARRPSLRNLVNLKMPRGPLLVRGDRNAIKQAVLDMLLNARRLGEGKTPCTLGVTDDGEQITIDVSTTLHDVPDGLEHLRHPHGAATLRDARISVSPTGLAHADRLARSMNGHLSVSARDKTVSIRLVLPLST